MQLRNLWWLMMLIAVGSVSLAQVQSQRGLSTAQREALGQIYERSYAATVRIETIPDGLGTGFFISDGGLVLTAYHVVKDADSLKVINFKEKSFGATVVGYDELRDLALVQAKVGEKVPFLELETRKALRPGEPILNIGNSRGEFIAPRIGLVTALDRTIAANFPAGMIASSMRLAPGDSGGPILSAEGRVVGVAVAIGYTETGVFQSFGAPLVGLEAFLGQLRVGYRRDAPYIGISPFVVDEHIARQFGVPPKGLMIQNVAPGGAGAKAGLRGENNIGPNDIPDIILEIDGVPVNSFDALVGEVRKRTVGDTITLTIRRDNKIILVPITLAPYPRRA